MHLVVYTIVSLASCLVNCIQALADLSVTMPCGRGKESKYVQRHSKCPGCGVEQKENADEVPLRLPRAAMGSMSRGDEDTIRRRFGESPAATPFLIEC